MFKATFLELVSVSIDRMRLVYPESFLSRMSICVFSGTFCGSKTSVLSGIATLPRRISLYPRCFDFARNFSSQAIQSFFFFEKEMTLIDVSYFPVESVIVLLLYIYVDLVSQ
jgi:hypothetical protein